MEPQLIMIETPQGIEELKTYLEDKEYVAYDCETTGLDKGSTIIGISICAEESKAYYIILAFWSTDTKSLMFTGLKYKITALLNTLQSKKLIMHNGVFDCMMAESYFKVNLIDSLHTDTMVLAHLINENRRIGLKELAVSIFGEGSDQEQKEMKASVIANGGAITKDNYEMYKADSQLMAKYGAKDALLTYRLFMHLVPQLYEQKLDKFFYEDECMPLLKGPTYQLNTTGLKVDTLALTTLKKTLETECEEDKAYVLSEINKVTKNDYPGTSKKKTFNLGSTQQLAWLMFGQLHLEFNTLTDAGLDACKDLGLKIPYYAAAKKQFIYECLRMQGQQQKPEATINSKIVKAKKFKAPWAYIACDKKALEMHASKYKWIAKLLKYQKNKKIISTYIEGIEERVKYGVINPSFLQTGTTSGRYSSRNPNFQNLPREDKRIKNCFIARPGMTFVGADFSQLEVRVFASVSGDPALIASFKTGEDFYSVVGIPIFGTYDATPYKEGSPEAFGVKYKQLRNMTKQIALASTYGANAHRIASIINKKKEETQEIIDTYFEKFPKVKAMMLEAHAIAKKDGQVTNIFGRPRRMPEATKITKLYGKTDHSDLPYEARNLLNLAVNHRIQSTAASICNRAMIKFYNDAKALNLTECRIVSQIHDEIIVECSEQSQDMVKLLLQNAMETAVELPDVGLEAIPTVARTLGDLK